MGRSSLEDVIAELRQSGEIRVGFALGETIHGSAEKRNTGGKPSSVRRTSYQIFNRDADSQLPLHGSGDFFGARPEDRIVEVRAGFIENAECEQAIHRRMSETANLREDVPYSVAAFMTVADFSERSRVIVALPILCFVESFQGHCIGITNRLEIASGRQLTPDIEGAPALPR